MSGRYNKCIVQGISINETRPTNILTSTYATKKTQLLSVVQILRIYKLHTD